MIFLFYLTQTASEHTLNKIQLKLRFVTNCSTRERSRTAEVTVKNNRIFHSARIADISAENYFLVKANVNRLKKTEKKKQRKCQTQKITYLCVTTSLERGNASDDILRLFFFVRNLAEKLPQKNKIMAPK